MFLLDVPVRPFLPIFSSPTCSLTRPSATPLTGIRRNPCATLPWNVWPSGQSDPRHKAREQRDARSFKLQTTGYSRSMKLRATGCDRRFAKWTESLSSSEHSLEHEFYNQVLNSVCANLQDVRLNVEIWSQFSHERLLVSFILAYKGARRLQNYDVVQKSRGRKI